MSSEVDMKQLIVKVGVAAVSGYLLWKIVQKTAEPCGRSAPIEEEKTEKKEDQSAPIEKKRTEKKEVQDYTFVPPPFLEDPNSYANNYEVRICNYELSLTADFEKKVLSGHIDIIVETLVDDAKVLTLDTKTLTIKSVSNQIGDDSVPCQFKLGEDKEPFGARLDINLPVSSRYKGTKTLLRIAYCTSPSSTAIQWLAPAQTAGKTHPYLFTQCQAIHARALIPTQDTPSNKCPYTASITVPAPLTALMSAISISNIKSQNGKTITYTFEQKVPIPSYLVALAIGALEKRDLSSRSAVWSEKEMVEAGAFEFAETEEFLSIGESICGPYVWGRYDILLLPPSFPYGGMENPCLTFVTPTLLAGDRSLATVVAHEISHSWMGNLVSAHTWEHFWMNEGFTVFLERKILKALKGNAAMHLDAIIGWDALTKSVERFGHDHAWTCLNIQLEGVDPDDAFSSVPYEKGFNFLFFLQSLVGEENMNKFLKAHCEKYKFSCVNCEVWKAFFLDYFKDKAKELEVVNWDKWLKEPGMPPNPNFITTLLNEAHRLAIDLVKGKGQLTETVDIKNWSSPQIVSFLMKLEALQTEYYNTRESMEISACKEQFASILEAIDATYTFSTSRNSEIRWHWLTVCIRAEMENAMQLATVFVTEQGRMKFVRPLYRELFQSVKGKQLAIDTFKKNQSIYHSIAQKMCSKDLQLSSS